MSVLLCDISSGPTAHIFLALIVYRIYRIQSRAANHTTFSSNSAQPYSRLVRTLIECGAMYTLSIVILFACYLADSNAILGVSNSVGHQTSASNCPSD